MKISSFEAENYRNMEKVRLDFSPGVNLLYGKNAQGKTNLIEGIYTFARGKSFRGATDADQVRFGERGFSLSLTFEEKEYGEQRLTYRYYDGERKRLRGAAPISLSEMMGKFRAVLFYPEHLDLVKGGPAERRLFLNIAISQLDKGYLRALSRYEKLREHRNAVLKEAAKFGYIDRDLLASYSEGMAEACATVAVARREYIDRLSGYAKDAQASLSGERERLSLRFSSDAGEITDKESVREKYIELYNTDISREMATGCSLFGVHRDDLEIFINDKEAKTFASQGQQRTAVLSLKMAEGEVCRERTGEYPVFLFDDVLSELDEGRRAVLLGGDGEKQIILTSCEGGERLGLAANEIYVEGGCYDPAHR
ncbi:MAG: DNA replication/repair protein RecF [Clostridia bacterium]|nr:DNA replication/repair protein RecF [Clostridia bacterium]